MSESEDPNKKRKRIRRACDFCRSKKAKCDGKSPVCSNCFANKEECIYSQPVKRRGLPTGYTHDLEKKVRLFQGLIARLCEDKYVQSRLQTILNDESLVDDLVELEKSWNSNSISELFDQVASQSNSKNNIAKLATHKPTPVRSDSSPVSILDGNPPLTTSQCQVCQKSQDRKFRKAHTPDPSQTISASPSTSQTATAATAATAAATVAADNAINPVIGSDRPTSIYPSTPSPFVSDSAFFLNYDVFQFISDEIEGVENPENWEPVALQYHGLSSIISGFTNKVVQQYNSKLNNVFKNPFRVGSIFNISSFAINASMTNKFQMPKEIFQFPINIRELVDIYFQVHQCYIPMLDRVSLIRHVNYLQSLPEHKRGSMDGNILALVWAVVALGEFSSIGGSVKKSSIFAKNAIMALENSFTTTIETIQAMITLGLVYYHLGQWDFSWVLISSGTRMAIDVRLMRNASDEDNPRVQSSASLNNINRQRTWATVYFVNTLLCARMGRSPVVRASDWPVPEINNDGWEEWSPWECYYAPNEIKLESGKFLSTFNETLKGVYILNLAITSTIDTSRGYYQNGEVKSEFKINYDDRQNSNNMTLEMFNDMIDAWSNQLPESFKDDQSNTGSKSPSTTILVLLRGLIWCVLAVRLSSLKGNSEIKDQIIQFRNQKYTEAIVAMKRCINENSENIWKHYFLFDYFLIMTFNFPYMMNFESEFMKYAHIQEMKNILVSCSETSIPCSICWDLLKIMNNGTKQRESSKLHDTPKAQESPTIANLLNDQADTEAVGPQPPTEVQPVASVPPMAPVAPNSSLTSVAPAPESAPAQVAAPPLVMAPAAPPISSSGNAPYISNDKNWVNQFGPPTTMLQDLHQVQSQPIYSNSNFHQQHKYYPHQISLEEPTSSLLQVNQIKQENTTSQPNNHNSNVK
ncbi:hypothetical protein MG3_02133 [Candida albicans P78048]|uniref:Zn(2)-C6 fungal-type domain-containing protein n=1 Tax=Candida albicans P78048 TaxID=1094989 RepID=A0AB34PUK8_CANAX|nr:hypothetical protein MG3_02133 [Candida albicans P78048]